MCTKVTREQLKHNFLKEIILSTEYFGPGEDEVAAAVQELLPYMINTKKYKPSELLKGKSALSEDETTPRPLHRIQGNGEQKSLYEKYEDEGSNIQVSISRQSLVLRIRKTNYVDFKNYTDEIVEILSKIIEKSNLFILKEVGIQKKNICYLRDVSHLHKYFEPKYFNVLNCDKEHRPVYVARDIFTETPYICSVERRVDFGKLRGEDVSRVLMVSDIRYTQENAVGKELNLESLKNETLNAMNEILFSIYLDSLTEEFCRKLEQTEFVDAEEIIGVEPNNKSADAK